MSPTHLIRAFVSGAAVLAALTFAGCGGGSSGGGGTTAPADTGEITLAVTDAATDEIDVFEVDIVGFRFEKRNGASVEILPQTTRVDFADLVTVSEVIAAATVPVGTYERAYMTLDFGSASVRITGNQTPAILRDGQGDPLSGREELEIVFPNGGFTVGARRGYFAVVDFDLDQSLMVDAAANEVEVDTILFATIDPAQPKDTRVPGLTSGFDGASTFDLDVRIGLGLVSRGSLEVQTDAATVYDLGASGVLTGQAGYDALEALGDDTLVVAVGTVDPRARTVDADRVVLLPQNLDEVGGLVVARSAGPGGDAVLTLKGVAVRRAQGSVTFNDTVTVRTSFAETVVNKRGVAAGALTTDAVNVGQRILAYGAFTGGDLDLTQPGAGFVRLVETGVSGAAAAAGGGGELAVDLVRIGRRRVGVFDFDVAGVSQADPDRYVADTAGLGLSGIDSGTPVIVRGFVAPVTSDAAAEPDFEADTVIDRSDTASLVRLAWIPAATDPITSRSGAEATLDAQSALFAQVDWGLVAPLALAADPTIAGVPNGLYAVRRAGRVTLFRDFSAFLNHVEAEVAAGARMWAFRSVGRWDDASDRLTAARAVAFLR